MKRFIPLSKDDTGYNFAWWDTVIERFETHQGEMAWDDFKDFAEVYEGTELERYRGLCPEKLR